MYSDLDFVIRTTTKTVGQPFSILEEALASKPVVGSQNISQFYATTANEAALDLPLEFLRNGLGSASHTENSVELILYDF